ncbi:MULTISPECIES: hypothetical protein [Rhodomicrobium]|uniref:hypothetical protein n=1 Tax=Rhodomicrobium TaxID=1068 RepID=UPI000B4AD01E|nr:MULTISPECIES: hypothetical protein [Rhodomicrobium]
MPDSQAQSSKSKIAWLADGVILSLMFSIVSLAVSLMQSSSQEKEEQARNAFRICETFLTSEVLTKSHGNVRRALPLLRQYDDLAPLLSQAEWAALKNDLLISVNYLDAAAKLINSKTVDTGISEHCLKSFMEGYAQIIKKHGKPKQDGFCPQDALICDLQQFDQLAQFVKEHEPKPPARVAKKGE